MFRNLNQYYVSSVYQKIIQLVQVNVVGIVVDRQVTIELITFLLDDQKEKILPRLIHVEIPYDNQNGYICLESIDHEVPMQINAKESTFMPEIAEMIDENIDIIKSEILDLLDSG
ncbi:hypothetical protein [Furfurilactobacillus entadae]|uniref:hypothetical protein n=1 Tax=Furfurilactobacillus entadae TaxID=2922307 RepID=UPI0035EFD39B